MKQEFPSPALALLLILFLVPAVYPAPAGAESPGRSSTLRVALLPILDVFPFYVAESLGAFGRRGINVKPVPVASALERDQVMQSGQIDGMLTEINTTAAFNRSRPQVRIVRFARIAYPDYPLFRILSSPGSNITSAKQLSGVGIGIARNTVIEYVTDRLLAAKGLPPEAVVKQSVPVIPERYHLLMQGRIQAAVLPDPLARSAMEAGATQVAADSEHPRYGVSVLAFSTRALEELGDAVRLFIQAWDEAVVRINEDPEGLRAVLLQKIPVPENIRKTYRIPRYPRNGVPDRAQWEDVLKWMQEKRLLDAPVSYDGSVTAEFLAGTR
ncbi:MAG: ABC transporter substrate-binding protein [Thermodesulfobacteriota bacterium]